MGVRPGAAGKKKKNNKKKATAIFFEAIKDCAGCSQRAACSVLFGSEGAEREPVAHGYVGRVEISAPLLPPPVPASEAVCDAGGGGQGERLNPKEGAEGCAACPSALLRAGVTGRVVSLVSREQQRVDQPNRASPGACSFGCPRQKGARPALQRRSVFKDRAVRFIYVTVQLSLPGAAEQVSGFVGVSLCFTSVSEASTCC